MRIHIANSSRIGALFLLLLSAATLGAQGGKTSTLVAGVADAETGQPLEGAEVLLTNVRRLARANGMGEATLSSIPYGVQHVRVRRLGYSPAEVDLAMSSDTTGAVFRLRRVPTELGAVHVEASWVPARMRDVEARRKRGIGRFLTEADLDKERDRDFNLMMTTRVPGLKTLIGSDGNRVLASTRDNLGMTGVSPCYVTLYLDGMIIDPKDSELVRTWDLAAVEFFQPAEVPVMYRNKPYGCGVVLLWSKWY
jgi:hypothetical protein